MRSLLRVGIRPMKNARISFSVQLALVLFWLVYVGFMLFTESATNDRNFLHYVFLALTLLYLVYILAQNTSIFGLQSYLEITPAYIVQKKGHFRPKLVIAFEDVAKVQILPFLLRFTLKNGEVINMDTKSIKRRKNIALVKENLELMAERHRFELQDNLMP
ncbi:hypothetical protein [Adhaeribacter soli]|uniref:Uncharacterized protein n=1 Tax=Adhaeribacter soli TaxID=2607655 RepID=A0A5N1J6H4_9BACT|nr:hypothetical protein [Adhaeribacter soli]KAA9340797.1 hypothetical protein F0P94_05050 [Adhaeribacter soli]